MFTRLGNKENIKHITPTVIKGAEYFNSELEKIRNNPFFEKEYQNEIEKCPKNKTKEEYTEDLQIRLAYLNAEKRISELLPQQEFEEGPADVCETKLRIYKDQSIDMRLGLRWQARELMPSIEDVEYLHEFDKKRYGDPDGPNREYLEKKYNATQGDIPSPSLTNLLIYYAAQKSNEGINKSLGIENPKQDNEQQDDQNPTKKL